MNKSLQWKIIGIVAIILFSLWLIWPPLALKDKDGNILEKGKINLGLDLQGGMHVVLRVDASKLSAEAKKDALDRAIEVIRNRIDQFGVGEMSIQKQGKDRIIVQLPGVTDRDRALELIGKTAHLEFKLVSDNQEDIKKAVNNEEVPGYELKYFDKGQGGREPLLIAKNASFTGDLLVDARTEFSSKGFGEPYVSIRLNNKGADIFAGVTAANIGKRLAIVLDGEIRSAPMIRETIPSGQAQITGSFSADEANDLAVVLRAGALPAPVIVEEERTVGPLLGADSIKSGVRATLIGALLVFLFMIFYYRMAGVVADIALGMNLLFILACLSLFHGTLTLPGIAGLILTIGMSVDANILIYERIREELNAGKGIKSAIATGYNRAFSAILDSNLTTIVAAALIFKFGTGPVRGFAVTLTIGLLANLFTAITCTRAIFELLYEQFGLAKLTMMQFFHKTSIDFISKRKICYTISAVIIIVGLVTFFARGEKNFGVDFTGGTLEQIMFQKPVKVDEIRSALKEIGSGNASIQQYGNPREVIIRTPDDISKNISDVFKQRFSDNPYQVMKIETVGPAVGKNLKQNATTSLILGIMGILVYIMFRFSLKYGIAGVVALFHDVLIVVGALALTRREFDLTIVAALLTIAGYSINDTIVIFDRIRENMRLVKKANFTEIVNMSINQTFSRTILTTAVTMLVVIALLFWGGEVLNSFAFCLCVGMIAGVYSTIFIASPLIISWRKHGSTK
ncbi:MAG: protein translocase subunit SecD [Candidatus Omnitrophica bacterium]|nr:protein translocase subunit SecD [Candidatus Omnitrophota bacterium]MBU4488307.1 protein translocase subunit SecD [Candidatus Omnitrophota bacterium]MCG2705639.1 protein translocase subunit SecD [Candidatus Omnitrophota bacterium]